MTKKNTTPTIILELTPREAAAINSLIWCANWNKGDYGSECYAIAMALEDVFDDFKQHDAFVADHCGIAVGGSFWLINEDHNDENLHPYSGA